ncbi:MAG TPA: winged helix-turn-helix domain-containing protein [Streptosporangiaceae bacterium]
MVDDQGPDIVHEGPTPIYVQIVDYVQAHIESGEWQPGHRLPAERAMAEAWGVAYLTIRRAMAELRKKGLIVSVQGRGTYVKEGRR